MYEWLYTPGSMSNSDVIQYYQMVATWIAAIAAIAAAVLAWKIGTKQNDLNEVLLGLNYVPSVLFTYNKSTKHFGFQNMGKANVFWWGNRVYATSESVGGENIESHGSLITPNGVYSSKADFLEPTALRCSENVASIFYDFFITDQNGKHYTFKNRLLCDKPDGTIQEVYTQTWSIVEGDWHPQTATNVTRSE